MCPSCKYPLVTWFQNKDEAYLLSYPCSQFRVETFPTGLIYHHVIYRLHSWRVRVGEVEKWKEKQETGRRQVRNDNNVSVFCEELPMSLLDSFGW